MLHRLSEAFQESITDTRKSVPTRSYQASFSKHIKEGWQDAPNTYAYPNAPLDPKTGTGLTTGQSLGGVEATKAHYDQIHRMANDNTKLNTDRAKEVKQAYGIDLPNASSSKIPGPTQVFAVGNAYVYKKADAPAVCAKYGSKVASTAQLEEAQRNGADWCYSGWVTEGVGKWPITTNPIPGCGSRQGIIEWTPDGHPQYGWDGTKAGINCYGPKPRPEEKTEDVIKPFNGTLWDQPTEKGYITIPNGYLETSGPQPACFNGLSPEQAQKNCDRLGSQCKGFSYSKDGGGHGCYKGNHDAGLNGNAAYMGYAKVGPQPIGNKRVIMTPYNWYNMFKRINSHFKITQAGQDHYVQLQMNSHAVYSSSTALWYNQRIQEYQQFTVEFELWISNANADGTSFNVGYSSEHHGLGEGPNPPAFSVSFHLYWPHRTPGIYIWNSKGQIVQFYRVSLGTSSWIPVKIVYMRGDVLTWQVFYNNAPILTYNDPTNEQWVTSTGGYESGSYFGFTSRTGGLTHDAYIRQFRLTAEE